MGLFTRLLRLRWRCAVVAAILVGNGVLFASWLQWRVDFLEAPETVYAQSDGKGYACACRSPVDSGRGCQLAELLLRPALSLNDHDVGDILASF